MRYPKKDIIQKRASAPKHVAQAWIKRKGGGQGNFRERNKAENLSNEEEEEGCAEKHKGLHFLNWPLQTRDKFFGGGAKQREKGRKKRGRDNSRMPLMRSVKERK